MFYSEHIRFNFKMFQLQTIRIGSIQTGLSLKIKKQYILSWGKQGISGKILNIIRMFRVKE